MTDTNDIQNRIKILIVTEPFLCDILHDRVKRLHSDAIATVEVCTVGIPDDAQWVAEYYDNTRRAFLFTIRHPSFEPVPEDKQIPLIHTLINRHKLVLTEDQKEQIRLAIK